MAEIGKQQIDIEADAAQSVGLQLSSVGLQLSHTTKLRRATVVSMVLVVALLGVVGGSCFYLASHAQSICEDKDHDSQPIMYGDDDVDFPIWSSSVCRAPCDVNAQPPSPDEKNLADWTTRAANASVDEDKGRQLSNGAVKTGVPMIIKSKYPGYWYDAELSWDTKSPHPMASVEFGDPVAWQFHPRQGYYSIHSMYPGRWENAELSWDTKSPHPMISVEFHDPVNWELVSKGDNKYRIKSKYPGHWKNAELSWDTKQPHPMASLEFNDPVDWEVTEAFTQRGFWQHTGTISSSGSSSRSIEVCHGTEQSFGWSKTETWSKSVSDSMTAGFEIGGDWLGGSVSGSRTVETSYSHELAITVSRDFGISYGKCMTDTYAAGPRSTNIWQFVVVTENNHYAHRGEKVYTTTQHVELTGRADEKPRCLPGYCEYDTACQVCLKPEACMESCVGVPPKSCTADRYHQAWCAYWKSFGFCGHSYVAWMNDNCQHTCQCMP